jgi:hypothetical protein
MLLILISKSENCQTSFGNGHYTGGTGTSSLLTTGSIINKGQFYGTNGTGVAVKVFHIENLWANLWKRITGMIYNNGKYYIKMTPEGVGYNLTADGYIDTDISCSGSSGNYISSQSMGANGRLPIVASGSQTTYTPDGLWWNTTQLNYVLLGGASDLGLACGFTLNMVDSPSTVVWVVGASPSYIG